MTRLRIGIDNYGLHPLGLDALATLNWARTNGAAGVQFSGVDPKNGGPVDDPAYLDELRNEAENNDLYLEWGGGQHIPFDTSNWQPLDTTAHNRRMAEQASRLGCSIIRSCSGGLMRWDSQSPSSESLLEESAKSLRSQSQIFRDYGVVLAIETHFEFTTHELIRLFEMCDCAPGDYLGICLDTMNLLTMLEDPLMGSSRILPWIVSTHMKDGAHLFSEEGFISFPAEIGKGVIELKTIINQLETLKRPTNLSIEDHGGEFTLPIFDPLFLSRFPDISVQEMTRLLGKCVESRKKIERGTLEITARDEWPGICETRLIRDINQLKRIVN